MLALTVRQPWAWAIVHAGKDIENRAWTPRGPNTGWARRLVETGERIAIHAGGSMTAREYDEFCVFCAARKIRCEVPPAADLVRGAIIGSVIITAVVDRARSKWWMGPLGLRLQAAQPEPIIVCRGSIAPMFWRAPC